VVLAEAVIAVRTWAVWHRHNVVGVGLGLMTIAHLVSQCVTVNKFSHSFQFLPFPYVGFRGCFLTHGSSIVWINFTLTAAVEAVVLILMSISAFRIYQQGSTGELAHVIHRDGILFYLYLLVVVVTNLAFTVAMPVEWVATLISLQIALYSVLTCRIILNIRGVAHQSIRPELHTSILELSRIQFISVGNQQEYELENVTNIITNGQAHE